MSLGRSSLTFVVELNRFAVAVEAATDFCMDNDRHKWQAGVGFRLCQVSTGSTGSSRNLLSHRHMDTLHCREDIGGSAVQFNSNVSAMPASHSRTFETPAHPGTADTLLVR